MARYYLQYGMGLDVDDVAGEIYIEHDGGIPTLEDNFIRAEGIMEQLQVSRATAYRIMSELPRYKLYDERGAGDHRHTVYMVHRAALDTYHRRKRGNPQFRDSLKQTILAQRFRNRK